MKKNRKHVSNKQNHDVSTPQENTWNELSSLRCCYSNDIFYFADNRGTFKLGPDIIGHAIFVKRSILGGVCCLHLRDASVYGGYRYIRVRDFPDDWVRAFPKLDHEYHVNGISKKLSKDASPAKRKVRIGWAIREGQPGYVKSDVCWLCICDDDVRMGCAREKIVFVNREDAVKQIRKMRSLCSSGVTWCNFPNLKLVKLFRTV